MLRVVPGPPVDYRRCDQTVTIYHQLGAGSAFGCSRVLFKGAFLDYRRTETMARTGSREAGSFLLVLPSGWAGRPVWVPPQSWAALTEAERKGRFTLAALDKVLPGEGPAITTREEWAALLPARAQGLVVVQSVDPKLWQGAVTHVEAGG